MAVGPHHSTKTSFAVIYCDHSWSLSPTRDYAHQRGSQLVQDKEKLTFHGRCDRDRSAARRRLRVQTTVDVRILWPQGSEQIGSRIARYVPEE